MPATPPPLPPRTWTPEPADAAQGNARTVVFKMAGVMAAVVAVAVGLLGAHWYYTSQADDDFEEALAEAAGPVETANGGAALDASEAALDVASDPAGATVFVNGDSVGVTPLQVPVREPGEQWVLVATGGRTVLDTTVQVGYGDVVALVGARRRTPTPEPAAAPAVTPEVQRGAIRVTSAPSGAAVLLDGRAVGETPLTIDGLSPGRYSLAVRRSGYEAVARTVAIRPGTRYEADLALQAVEAPEPVARPAPARPAPTPAPPRPEPVGTGTVEVLVRPWGRIEIDGQVRQRESDVVYRTELPVGTHRVRVSHPVLGSQERTVEVSRGVTYRIDVDLGSDG